MDVGYLGAFLGGLLSLLSPCSVMLLPAFFSYAFSNPATLVARTGLFYLGLITTLVPLGVFAGTIGSFLVANRGLLMTIVAIVVIVFGLVQVLGIPIPGLTRRGSDDAGSPFAVYMLGTAYGVAGVCTGPILGSVLMIAALGANPIYGAILLAVYAAGMALPLLIIALAWKRWGAKLRTALMPRTVRIGRWENSWHALIAGVLSIVLGVILLIFARDPEGAGILPIGVQYGLESGVATLGAAVSNVVVIVGAVVLAAVIAGVWWWRSRRRATATTTD